MGVLYEGACITLVVMPPDRAIWLEKFRLNSQAVLELRDAPDHVRGDREVICAAIALGHIAERTIDDDDGDDDLFDDDECDEGERHRGVVLSWASEDLRSDPDVVMAAAIGSDGMALRWASRELRDNLPFML